jgi:molybdenum cofactor cytidylyltransferase
MGEAPCYLHLVSRAPSFAGVILAAGESSRMGSEKALLEWHGASLLAANIDRMTPFCDLVLVVGGANSEVLKPDVYRRAAFLVTNTHPERGQFSSLQVGLQEVLNRGRDAAIITHVDRPPAKASTLSMLLAQFKDSYSEGTWAVVPRVAEVHGHPIIIGREMMEAFLCAPHTSTARDVEHANQQKLMYINVEDAAVVTNINTPENYASAKTLL